MRAERRLRGNGLAGWRNAAGAQNIRLAGRMHFPGAGPADASRRPGDQCPLHSVPHGYSDLPSRPRPPGGQASHRIVFPAPADRPHALVPAHSPGPDRQVDSYCKPPAGGWRTSTRRRRRPPGDLHVISTGSTADLHTGLVGCGDIDDGGVGQGSHDPVGIAAVGLVHPGGLGSDPVQRTEYSPRVTPGPGTSSCTDGRQGMLLTTTSTLQDRHIDDYKGVVSGEAILGANAFRDMFAGIRDIVGGRSAAYERELQKAKDLAISEMVERARDTGANAVIGIDLDYETVGQNGSMLMVTASGTAVVVT